MAPSWTKKANDRPGFEIEQPSMRRPRTTPFQLKVTIGEQGSAVNQAARRS
jgi:hypothetical protein